MASIDLTLATAAALSGGQLASAARSDRTAASGRPAPSAAHAARYASSATRASWQAAAGGGGARAADDASSRSSSFSPLPRGGREEVEAEAGSRRAQARAYSVEAMAASIWDMRDSGFEGKLRIASNGLQPRRPPPALPDMPAAAVRIRIDG